MRKRIKHFSDIKTANKSQCTGKVYKRIGCLKLVFEDVNCIECLKRELFIPNIKQSIKEQIEEKIKNLTYSEEFDKILK